MQDRVDLNICLGLATSKVPQLIVKSLWESLEQSSTSSKHNIVIETDLEVLITLLNRVVGKSCNTTVTVLQLRMALSNKSWLEDALSSCDSLVMVDLNDVSSWKFIRPLLDREWVVS